MLIYIFLLFITLLFDFLYQQKKISKNSCVFIFMALCILFTTISAIRYNVGTDFKNTYSNAFTWLKLGYKYPYEPLFLKLNYFIINLGGNIQHLIAFCSIITVPSFFWLIYKNVDDKYRFFSIFLFIGSTIYYASMNVIRQYLAIAIIIFSIRWLKDKKYFLYVLAILFAMQFHTSAAFNFFILLAYLIYKKVSSNNKKMSIVLLIIYLISIFGIIYDFRNIINMFDFIIPGKYVAYLNTVFVKEKNYSALIKLVIPNFLLILGLKNRREFNDEGLKLYSFIAIYLLTIISNMFYGINVFVRLTWFCDIYLLLFIPYIIDIYKKRDTIVILSKGVSIKFYNVIKLLLIVYFISYNFMSIFYGGGHGVVPYNTFFKNI